MYLCSLQVLQNEVPELRGSVQQQKLEASRGDVGRLSGLTGEGTREQQNRDSLGDPEPLQVDTSEVPLHETRLDEQLRQVLTDDGTGRAHHEVQDDLPALHGVLVQALDVSSVAIWTQGAAFVHPGLDPRGGHTTKVCKGSPSSRSSRRRATGLVPVIFELSSKR